jgi:hypothetical protein
VRRGAVTSDTGRCCSRLGLRESREDEARVCAAVATMTRGRSSVGSGRTKREDGREITEREVDMATPEDAMGGAVDGLGSPSCSGMSLTRVCLRMASVRASAGRGGTTVAIRKCCMAAEPFGHGVTSASSQRSAMQGGVTVVDRSRAGRRVRSRTTLITYWRGCTRVCTVRFVCCMVVMHWDHHCAAMEAALE